MINEVHPFKCGACKKVTAHREIKRYDTSDVAEMPVETWLLECQNCFEMRIIDPAERLASREDDITRCSQCGNYKLKAAQCRVCKIATGQQQLMVKYWNGNTTLERATDADL